MRPSLYPLLTVMLALLVLPVARATPPGSFAADALDSGFPNPERGFYRQDAPLWIGEERGFPDVETLRGWRDTEGISLLRRYFILDEFRAAPLDAAALEVIRASFDTARAAGMKVIPRFAYNFPTGGTYPYQEPDAPLEQVLAHLGQLEPVLRENADIIAFMEIGLVGAWGEWHSSTSHLVDFPEGINENSRAIVERLLQVLPPERMIAMRYPPYKQALYGSTPLSAATAYSGTPAARMGAHNDCFLASSTDWGTYPEDAAAREALKTFLSLDNRFLPQGGETCNAGADARPYIGCDNALIDLARLRFSTLNIGYEEQVLDGWRSGGCLTAIADRLGYRFRLTEATVSTTAAPGGPLAIRFSVVNDGFAAPYNPRGLEIILRSSSGALFRLPLATAPDRDHNRNHDPRFWLPDAGEITISVQAGLPATMPPGEYAVLLNLPDPQPALYSRPEYAIRLANHGVWEAATGFNRLNATVTVTAAPAVPPYAGPPVFIQH